MPRGVDYEVEILDLEGGETPEAQGMEAHEPRYRSFKHRWRTRAPAPRRPRS